MDEHGAHFAIRALPDRRLVSKQDQLLAGAGVAQAAAEGLAACGAHLLDAIS